jgi:hypothetical protein
MCVQEVYRRIGFICAGQLHVNVKTARKPIERLDDNVVVKMTLVPVSLARFWNALYYSGKKDAHSPPMWFPAAD